MPDAVIPGMAEERRMITEGDETMNARCMDQIEGERFKAFNGDSIEIVAELPENSIGLSVFSPPFPGMYAYTNSARDVGNVRNFAELVEHFSYLAGSLLKVTQPGRMCCVHLTQEPVFKGRDGYVGLRDFRGDMIRCMESAGWNYYSEVTIDKNPMLKASRTKEATLLFKTLAADSSMSRPALADYIIVFKKPGTNSNPIRAGISARYDNRDGWITCDEWCEWAAPVWYRKMPAEKSPHYPFQDNYPSRHQATDGINEGDVLRNFTQGRENDDEKHLCPLQLGVIERCVKLWSNPDDVVLSPFMGIGSEGYVAIRHNRRFVGCELKPSYFRVACTNLRDAERRRIAKDADLFGSVSDAEGGK
jgi:DNA modification methylase